MRRFGFCIFNARTAAAPMIPQMLSEISSAVGYKSTIAFQEIDSWEASSYVAEGWGAWDLIRSKHKRGPGVAVPSEALIGLRATNFEGMWNVGVALDNFGYVSSYLPDRFKPVSTFIEACDELDKVVVWMKKKGCTQIFLGMDGNLSVPGDFEGLTGPSVAPYPGSSDAESQRRSALLGVVRRRGLVFASTWGEGMLDGTEMYCARWPWGANQSATQLDYVLTSSTVQSTCKTHNNRSWLNSDHVVVSSVPGGSSSKCRVKAFRQSMVGWEPSADGKEIFKTKLTKTIGVTGIATRGLISSYTIQDFSDSVASIANEVEHSITAMRAREARVVPSELRELRRRLRTEHMRISERKALRKEEQQQYRKHRAALYAQQTAEQERRAPLAVRGNHPPTGVRKLEVGGVLSEDRSEWQHELFDVCQTVYFDPSESPWVQAERVAWLSAVASREKNAGLAPPEISYDVVCKAKANLKVNRAGNRSCIVNEMLREIPTSMDLLVSEFFINRVNGSSRQPRGNGRAEARDGAGPRSSTGHRLSSRVASAARDTAFGEVCVFRACGSGEGAQSSLPHATETSPRDKGCVARPLFLIAYSLGTRLST